MGTYRHGQAVAKLWSLRDRTAGHYHVQERLGNHCCCITVTAVFSHGLLVPELLKEFSVIELKLDTLTRGYHLSLPPVTGIQPTPSHLVSKDNFDNILPFTDTYFRTIPRGFLNAGCMYDAIFVVHGTRKATSFSTLTFCVITVALSPREPAFTALQHFVWNDVNFTDGQIDISLPDGGKLRMMYGTFGSAMRGI